MFNIQDRYASYKRGVVWFVIYSIVLFVAKSTSFLNLKTLTYLLVGFALSGAFTVLFMNIQRKVKTKLSDQFLVLNIVVEVVGYYVYTHTMFYLFYLV